MASPPVALPWPPAVGMPREQLFGDHPDETVVSPGVETAGFPYRRRYCDPWFRLSNLRVLPPEGDKVQVQKLAVDVEVVTPPAKPSSVNFEIYRASDDDRHGYPVSASSRDLAKVIESGKGTVTIMLFPFTTKDEKVNHLEVYLVTTEPHYVVERKSRRPGKHATWTSAATFKVSASIMLGPVSTSRPPRDWTPEEITALTGPPGKFSFLFEI